MRAMNLVGPSQMIMYPDRIETQRLGFLSDIKIDCGDAERTEMGRRMPKVIFCRLLIGAPLGSRSITKIVTHATKRNDPNRSSDDR